MTGRHHVRNKVTQETKPKQLAISERKLKANRENSRKSTGPTTPRGKALSRRNAIKHGIFVNYVTDFEALDEDPTEYRRLLNGLWDQYQPVGLAEEVEVERIALCCWRLKRIWRYENAINLAARRDFLRAELKDQGEYCEEKKKGELAVLAQLQIAKKEVEDSGRVSAEIKQSVFGLDPDLEQGWLALEEKALERMEQSDFAEFARKFSPERRIWARDIYVVTQLIAFFEQVGPRRWNNVIETALGRHAIPNSDALDRILRYETTIERYRSRSIEQLDRLQRRRMGELVPPAVRVHLT